MGKRLLAVTKIPLYAFFPIFVQIMMKRTEDGKENQEEQMKLRDISQNKTIKMQQRRNERLENVFQVD